MTNKRDLRQQLGQLLIVGFEAADMSPGLKSLLTRIQPAGVILFGRNIVSATQTFQLLADCRACVTTPMFTCVDLEGGLVDRLRKVVGPAPSPAEVFATGKRSAYRKHGRVIGDSCRALGLNTDLAPAVDLAFEASRTVMGSRAVSDDPKQVVLYAREFLAGLKSADVLGAIKHFPGLGEANLDTHHELPSVGKSWKKLWAEDLYPFRALKGDAPMVLVSHAAYPQITKDGTPASLSRKWITNVLRKKVGYCGLVVSDDLEMGGVLAKGPIEHATVEHIRAGGDLALICRQADFVARGYEALVREVERDPKFARRAAESVTSVLAFKKKTGLLRAKQAAPTAAIVVKLSEQLREFSEQVRG